MIAGYAILIVMGLEDLNLLTPKSDPWLHLFQGLAVLALIGTLVALANAVRAWGSRVRGVWSKLGETLIALSCLGMSWLILAGKLLHIGPAY